MRRYSTALAMAALLTSGCDWMGEDCEVVLDSLGLPQCSPDQGDILENPIVGLGYEIPDGAPLPPGAVGTVTAVIGTTLHIDVGGRAIAFRWHGELPEPVSVGQQVGVHPGDTRDFLSTGDYQWVVFKPHGGSGRPHEKYNHGGHGLCIDQFFGCQASDELFGLDFEIRSALFQTTVSAGQTAHIGNWMVSNLGASYVSPLSCETEVAPAAIAGHLIAWTVDMADDPAWCSSDMRQGHRAFSGLFGVAASLEDESMTGTVDQMSEDVVTVATARGPVYFVWPGSLPEGLQTGDAVELQQGADRSSLKSDRLLLWVLDTSAFTPGGLPVGEFPEGLQIEYRDGCTLSNNAVSQDAFITGEEGEIRLLPGESAPVGPWHVTHHHGFHTGSLDCGMAYDSGVRRVTSAFRTLGE